MPEVDTLTFPFIPMNNRDSERLHNLANVSVSGRTETKLEITGSYHFFCLLLCAAEVQFSVWDKVDA